MFAASPAQPIERYTIRQHPLSLCSSGVYIHGSDGSVLGYCEQRSFRQRADLHVYTDEWCERKLMRICVRRGSLCGAVFTVRLTTGETLGTIRCRGRRFLLGRESWHAFGPTGRMVCEWVEESWLPTGLWELLRLMCIVPPQWHALVPPRSDSSEDVIARVRQSSVLFAMRLDVTFERDSADQLLVLALACVVLLADAPRD